MPGGSSRDVLAEQMAAGRKVLVPLLAEMLATDRVTALGAAEVRRRFWEAAITDEEEDRLWAEGMLRAGITGPVTPEQMPTMVRIGLDISNQKYPGRWDMARAEGRTTDAQMAEWALKHALKGPPAPKQEAPAPAPDDAMGGEE